MPNGSPDSIHIDLTSLIGAIGPKGLLALFVLACVLLLRSKAGRKAARRILKRVIRWVRNALWAWRYGIPLHVAAVLVERERWDGMVNARRLGGLHRGRIRRTPVGVSVALGLRAPLTLSSVQGHVDQIEAGLGLRHGTARVLSAKRADKATLQLVTRDPLAKSVGWTPAPAPVRLGQPVKLSLTPFGDAVEIDVRQRIGIFGTSGSGKSCTQRVLAAHVIAAVDADLTVIDCKFGTESQHFEGKAHRITTVGAAAAYIDWLIDVEFPRRAERMREQGTSQWQETEADPALVVLVDEGNVLVRGLSREQLNRLFQAFEQGRALGVYFQWATQFPKATNLPTEIRSQLNVRICLLLNSSEESAVVFKEEAGQGWEPHKLAGPGWMLVRSDKHRAPVESKSLWLDTDRFREIEPGRPVAEPTETAAAPVSLSKAVPAQGGVQVAVPRTEPTVAEMVWSVLAMAEQPMGIRDIARALDRNPGTVSRALAKLVSSGDAVRGEGDKYTAALTAAEG